MSFVITLFQPEESLRFSPALLEPGSAIKVFCFDVDGGIAEIQKDNDYIKCGPLRENVQLINRLFDAGHEIILFTARGTMTGIDWRKTTERQMKDWGVQYHQLSFGKPAADFYIDDKAVTLPMLSSLVGKG